MINNDNLISAVGVDYSNLRNLLAAQKWKEADEETVYKLKEVLGREHPADILLADIKGFFCEDLLTIDQLWLKYSKGRFGLSVQKRIWEILYKDWNMLGDRVGWRADGKWMYRDELTYNLNAPPGHLPVNIWGQFGFFSKSNDRWTVGGNEIHWVFCLIGRPPHRAQLLFQRLEYCSLCQTGARSSGRAGFKFIIKLTLSKSDRLLNKFASAIRATVICNSQKVGTKSAHLLKKPQYTLSPHNKCSAATPPAILTTRA
ncbi:MULTISPECIES: GUN4 domain-containing protein [unclassified Microcoleus]|uniref:GUN4 domain-containing protein n=1 Tax=unclassified Microcoleus TaxID=2642155 RepID=UPI002FD6A223